MKHATFYVDSRKRLPGGTDGSFSFKLPINLSIPYDRVCLMAANIPKTYYQINQGFNSFTLVEGALEATVSIPIGTYGRSTFASVLAALLTSTSPSRFTYNISFPNTNVAAETGLFTYTCSNATPQFIFSTNSLVFEQMGFAPLSTNSFVGGTLVSTSVTNFASETCLFLRSSICSNASSQDNILQEIYTNGTQYNSYISYINYTPEETAKRFCPGQVFTFNLTDENGVPVNLNGVNAVFTLRVWIHNRFEALHEQFIRYMVNKDDDENTEV